jgi:predicted alpha/beta-hydrolase family hydrolase
VISVDELDVRTNDGPLPTRLYRSDREGGILLVLAPGAGASHSHPFMVAVASALAEQGIHVRTFDFHYMAEGRKAPDRIPKLMAAYRKVLDDSRARLGGTLFVGGKSMGSRVAAEMACEAGREGASDLAGLVAFGYPLAPKGRDSERAPRQALLASVPLPLLVVQGERDAFGGAAVLSEVVREIDAGSGRARLAIVADADHAFELPKRALAGRTRDEVWRTVGAMAASFVHEVAAHCSAPGLSAAVRDLV